MLPKSNLIDEVRHRVQQRISDVPVGTCEKASEDPNAADASRAVIKPLGGVFERDFTYDQEQNRSSSPNLKVYGAVWSDFYYVSIDKRNKKYHKSETINMNGKDFARLNLISPAFSDSAYVFLQYEKNSTQVSALFDLIVQYESRTDLVTQKLTQVDITQMDPELNELLEKRFLRESAVLMGYKIPQGFTSKILSQPGEKFFVLLQVQTDSIASNTASPILHNQKFGPDGPFSDLLLQVKRKDNGESHCSDSYIRIRVNSNLFYNQSKLVREHTSRITTKMQLGMYEDFTPDGQYKVLNIEEEISEDAVTRLLKFVYDGDINFLSLTPQDSMELYKAIQEMKMESLLPIIRNRIAFLLPLNPSFIFIANDLAKLYNDSLLCDICSRTYASCRHSMMENPDYELFRQARRDDSLLALANVKF